MILIDFNQAAISSLMSYIQKQPKGSVLVNTDLIRHIFLNSLRTYSKQFRSKYKNLVVCCDSRKYWRKDVFPHYKANRKKERDKSGLDWKTIFNAMDILRSEMKESFLYKVIDVEGAEADDIIGSLAAKFSVHEPVLIVSSDKDFMQLQRYSNVSQYSPWHERFLKTDDPEMFLKEHIIRGDFGDGIPNFLSADNCIVIGERQKSINKDKLAKWLIETPENFCVDENMLRNYKRNQILVDLTFIPSTLKESILTAYDSAKSSNRMDFLNYLLNNKLGNLAEFLDDF